MIHSRLAVLMAERNLKLRELAQRIGIDEVNLSKIKTGKLKALRLSTLNALCRELECQPSDLLIYRPDE
ncbi:MAG: helix-turn-helix transcriptional regulator [Candidatus Sericytochromatia bacterium]|nr:helix-turn-helix transcriptional regulator [Candidatus Sericytochromatia bacterium]